jgi:serine/threonine protein phosphatase PrpC
MRPLRDMSSVQVDSVLYHSAFGFARVVHVGPQQADLAWEKRGDNLPSSVSFEHLRRVYALCRPNGFFHRAVHEPERLRHQLQVNPPQAIESLLEDLQGPQRKTDIKDWVLSRGLLTERAFEPWWKQLLALIQSDGRFHLENDRLFLEKGVALVGPVGRLRADNLSPGRRIDIALANRDALKDSFFLDQIGRAWRTGASQVRDLALSALKERDPEQVFAVLLKPGPSNIEALIHLLRRGPWSPQDVGASTLDALLNRVLKGIDDGGPLDNEGRLAATLVRWQCPGTVSLMAKLGALPDGRRLLRATLANLPPKRAETFGLDMLDSAIELADEAASQWIAGELLGLLLLDTQEMADRLAGRRPQLSTWFIECYQEIPSHIRQDFDDYTEDTALTGEIERRGPVLLKDLQVTTGGGLLRLVLSLSRELAAHHKKGEVVHPSATSIRVLPDESIEIDAGRPDESPRPPLEEPSQTADVYATAVLLIERMVGKPWPRNLHGGRALPYLRSIMPLLPPSIMAPLAAALHPNPSRRPANGVAWQLLWQQVAIAEEARGYAFHDANALLEFGYDTHVGQAKIMSTQTNQDAIYATTDGSCGLMIVCDGISTANTGSGDIAAGIATQIVANLWEQALPRLQEAGAPEMRDFLDRAMRMANLAVCEAAMRFAGGSLNGRIPMGTTCVAAITRGNWVSLAWLGDSRAYLVGPYGASLLTADDNQSRERLRSWQLGYQDKWDPQGHALVAYIGHFDETEQAEALQPHHLSFNLLQGERLLLCSDGVVDYLGESEPDVARAIGRLVSRSTNLFGIATEVVRQANLGGGGDNASCIIGAIST